MIKKIFISLKSLGFKKTIIKLIFKLFDYFSFKNYKRKKFEKNIFTIKSVEERFNKIYSTNYWFDNESRSGAGSTLKSTENIRFHLPKILEKFNIKKLFDAPCGDFNWMSQVLKNIEIDYLGSDIVTGDFHKIDLFSKPFNFEKNYIYNFDDKDKLEIQHFKQMHLFSKLQIKNILLNT